jgi:hypothetical protein
MKSLTEEVHPRELLVVETGGDRCHICPSFREGTRVRSCTSLLYGPTETLSQQRQWPDHICYDDFLRRSTELWAAKVLYEIKVLYETDSTANSLWAGSYPLPIGRAAVRELYASHGRCCDDRLIERLPFEGRRRALWALRIVGDRSVLDMFGLEDRSAPADDHLYFDGLAYALRGIDDVSLLPLVSAGDAWWRDFSWKKIRGRPRGSGTWESSSNLKRALHSAVRELRERGHKVTQETVAELFQTNDRVLRRWLTDNGISWEEVKKP